MAKKIRFGLRHVKFAIYNDGEYGTPEDFPGAVSMTMSREGGDATDFYADDGIYYSFAGSNGGYSVELNMAMVTDHVRELLLGEELDSNGVQWEFTGNEPPTFALIYETQTNEGPIAFCMYGCKASRIETSANTKSDSPEVDSDTMNVRVSGSDFIVGGETKHAIQSHIGKTADNVAKYDEFFTKVAVPATVVADAA